MARARVYGHSGNTAEERARRHELQSLERMSLGWAWNNAKNAAALTRELIYWATPENAEPPEALEARRVIAEILDLLTAYVNDLSMTVPDGFMTPEDHPRTRMYWYAHHLGKHVLETTEQAACVLQVARSTNDCTHWRIAGRAASAATEFLLKWATENPTVGTAEGVGAAVLHKISHALAAHRPTEEITGRMFEWRVKDALRGRVLDPALEANLRPAFEAAWMAKEFEFAYSLLDSLDTLAESSDTIA